MNTSIDQPAARLALVSSQRLILLLILLFAQRSGFGQSEPASVLTKNAYLSNPAQYLSKVNPNLIPSGTLIDRVVYDDLILNVNGKDKVTTIAVNDWVRIFNELKYANADTSYLGSISRVERITDLYYEQDMTYPIGILDFNFNRIEQGSLDRGELVEGDEFLDARRAKASSFSKRRVVVASCLSHSIYGDDVNFVVSNLLYRNNIKDQVLQSVEVDFGNGEGFRRVNLSEMVRVSYSSVSEYVEIKTKLTYKNVATGKTETYYAHSSVFRTGTSTVPIPNIVPTAENGRTYSTPAKLPEPIYYPEKITTKETICGSPVGDPVPYNPNDPNQCCCETFTTVTNNSKIVAHILFSDKNTSGGKLRRPFIVTDGFDPNDKRDYYRTDINIAEQLPRDRDQRGLYQLVNGDPSPWYSDKETTSPNLIAALRADGYDLVFINFRDGAGYIQTNADYLRRFLSEILNGSKYRDNKTEEAILVGPSMGGIITRIVLKTMEDVNQDPFVKTWISFDSPQQGANIPISLQQTVKSLKDAVLLPAGKKGPLEESLDKLNSPAARELLLAHYTAGGAGTAEHNRLYTYLANLKYPVYSKNYAITNGGTSKLYPTDGSQTIDFAVKGKDQISATWGMVVYAVFKFPGLIALNASLFKRTGYGSKNVGNQIALDNAPGGWNSALYTFNLDPGNSRDIKETNIPYTKATFIPTTSAFGIKVTQGNVARIWTSYKASDTPFDEIRGMGGISEEHVRISAATRDYLMGELHGDFDNTARPRIRSGQVLNQKVKGKEAITAKLTIKLGGNSNSFTLESGADVIASAGQSITLLPGFTAQAGANFVAKIATINYNTVLRSAVANLETASVDYTQVSPYTGAVYAYQQDEVVSAIGPDRMEVVAYPNPLEDVVILQVTELEEPYAKVEISNALGQIVYQSNHLVNGLNPIDLTKMGSGLYYGKVTYRDSKTKSFKLIKL